MKKLMRAALIAFGFVLGFVAGGLLGFFWIYYGGQLVFGPEFLQYGWVCLFFTVPGGAVLGAAIGGQTIDERPRVFAAVVLPLSLVLISVPVTFSILKSMDRPRTYKLELAGTPGARYVGIVSVNGEKFQDLKGELPAQHVFNGLRVDFAIALENSNADNRITVEVFANAKKLDTLGESNTGVHHHLKSFGYSEKFGGTSAHASRMNEEEVKALIKENKMPMTIGWVP